MSFFRARSLIALVLSAECAACARMGPPPGGFMTSATTSNSLPSRPLGTRGLAVAAAAEDDIEVIVRDDDDREICRAPCTAWIAKRNDARIEIVGQHVFDVPVELDVVPPGQTLNVVAHSKKGHPGAAFPLIATGTLLSALFGATAVKVCGDAMQEKDHNGGILFCDWALGITAINLVLLTAGILFGVTSEWPRVDVAPSR